MAGRRRRSDEKRRQIREAAYGCLKTHGYNDASVDAVCTRAGISKGSFYWHFSSKQEVFIDLLDEWSREIMDELYEQFENPSQQTDFIPALSAALHREMHRARVLVPLWLEFTMLAHRDPGVQVALAKFFRRARTAIAEMLRAMVGPHPTHDEISSLAAAIFGAYIGLVVQEIADKREAASSEAVMNLMQVFGRWMRQATGTDGPVVDVPDFRGERVSDVDFQTFLHGTSESESGRMTEVRDLIRRTVPTADERIITGWGQLAYGQNGLFCSVRSHRKRLVLSFQQGIELEAPEGTKLKGSAKRARSLWIPHDEPIPTALVEGLVRQAWALQCE